MALFWNNYLAQYGYNEHVQQTLPALMVEFDNLMLRAVRWFFNGVPSASHSMIDLINNAAHRHGVWQFVAHLPFRYLSLPMAWRIFALIVSVRATGICMQIDVLSERQHCAHDRAVPGVARVHLC